MGREQEARHVLLAMQLNPSLATAQFRVGTNLPDYFANPDEHGKSNDRNKI
jgi:hypothetical protein